MGCDQEMQPAKPALKICARKRRRLQPRRLISSSRPLLAPSQSSKRRLLSLWPAPGSLSIPDNSRPLVLILIFVCCTLACTDGIAIPRHDGIVRGCMELMSVAMLELWIPGNLWSEALPKTGRWVPRYDGIIWGCLDLRSVAMLEPCIPRMIWSRALPQTGRWAPRHDGIVRGCMKLRSVATFERWIPRTLWS